MFSLFSWFQNSKKTDKQVSYYYLSLLKNDKIKSGYSIHGLWPQYDETSYPQFCKKVDFDINKLSNIENDLLNYWELPEDHDKLEITFWKHEWEKHGSCMACYMTEFEYFSKTLDLYKWVINNLDIQKYKKGNNYLIPFDLNFNLCV